MDKFTCMSLYVKVVEMGSFTAVASHLDTTVSNVSRAVSSLEQGLDTRLLQRSTRRLHVTDAGQRFYARCLAILAALDEAETEARDLLGEPRGILRVHCVPGLARHLVTDTALLYRQRFPQASVELLLSQRMPNLLEEQLDLSVQIARSLPDSSYVSQKIGESYCVLAASPDYLARHPAPQAPEDLAAHRCIRLATVDYSSEQWQLRSGDQSVVFRPAGAYLSINDMDAMATALRAGAGIGLLAGFAAVEDLRNGRLVRVLPGYHSESRNVYAVYASRQFTDARIRGFIEVLKECTGDALQQQALELGCV